MGEKKIFISDIHMGMGEKWDLLGDSSEGRRKELVQFLQHVGTQDDVTEIIFLGDILDNWTCPIGTAPNWITPPSLKQIFQKDINGPIFEQINNLAKKENLKIYYVGGNHDMGINSELLNGSDGFLPKVNLVGAYRSGLLLAEHGHTYTYFNCPDPIHDPVNKLPIGYYITRIVATQVITRGAATHDPMDYLDELIKIMLKEKMIDSIIDAIAAESKVPDDSEIIITGEPPKKVSEVKKEYCNYTKEWEEKNNESATVSLAEELANLEPIANYLCTSKGDTNIVIFGHTHNKFLRKQPFDNWPYPNYANPPKEIIYANSGTWSSDKKPCTFIETEKNYDDMKHYVRLYKWEDGSPDLIQPQEFVTLG